MAASSMEPKVYYYLEDETTPYLIRINGVTLDDFTLADLKETLQARNHLKSNYKFFFKSQDADLGSVKEEIIDDNAKLPSCKGRILCWLVSADGSAHSDTMSQCTMENLITPTPGACLGRTAGIGESRPPSFHVNNDGMDQTGNTSETESTISGLPHFPRHNKLDRRALRSPFHDGRRGVIAGLRRPPASGRFPNDTASSAMTTDVDSTSFIDSEDDLQSRVSTSTDITSVSRMYLKTRRRKRRAPSRTSSFSSVTESSMSLNIISVSLNMDSVHYLGMSVVGQTNQSTGDGGIYVGKVMPGGAVALDGRIAPGDLIIQVNDVVFESMSNDDAVKVLRQAVANPGPVKLVVAKMWDPNPKGFFTVPRQEPVRPIDPGAWVAHTEAMRNNMPMGLPPPPNDYPARPPSVATMTSNSGSLTSSVPESDRYWQQEDIQLDLAQLGDNILPVVCAMARPDSGLDVRDRLWLKITIPNAFIGSDVVDWLMKHCKNGLHDRKEARRYAGRMLKEGYIKHTVNKISFSEQCYYVFKDLYNEFSAMNLNSGGGPLSYHGSCNNSNMPPGSYNEAMMDGGSDRDTVAPLPPPPPMAPTPTPWAMGHVPRPYPTPSPQPVVGGLGVGSLGSLSSGGDNLLMGRGGYGGPPTARSDLTRSSEINSTASGGSGASGSGSDNSRHQYRASTAANPSGMTGSVGNYKNAASFASQPKGCPTHISGHRPQLQQPQGATYARSIASLSASSGGSNNGGGGSGSDSGTGPLINSGHGGGKNVTGGGNKSAFSYGGSNNSSGGKGTPPPIAPKSAPSSQHGPGSAGPLVGGNSAEPETPPPPYPGYPTPLATSSPIVNATGSSANNSGNSYSSGVSKSGEGVGASLPVPSAPPVLQSTFGTKPFPIPTTLTSTSGGGYVGVGTDDSVGGDGGTVESSRLVGSQQGLDVVPPDLSGSRQSFKIAMGNPCAEYIVDAM